LSTGIRTKTSKEKQTEEYEMKKLLLLFVLIASAASVFAQQGEPVYVAGCYGGYLKEFAEKGSTIKQVMQYVQNGKIYFTSIALSDKAGNLQPGFEFFISEKDIIGIYRGRQTDPIAANAIVGVAGFVEAGKITITHVFFSDKEADNWVKSENIKLVYYSKIY
jgi:hypothetical protein